MRSARPVIVWFRQDLRLADNPALSGAVATGAPILPVYILDDEHAGEWAMGAASRWWLHESLASLDASLAGGLHVRRGSADAVILELAARVRAAAVYWNRCYEPWRVGRDRSVASLLHEQGSEVHTYNGSLLFEPATVTKADGTPYKVFTPFFRNGCLKDGPAPRAVLKAPSVKSPFELEPRTTLEALELLPEIPWYAEMADVWSPGEAGAHARLKRFLETGLTHYKIGRDHPEQQSVSRLSPHLHFGEISPNQIWSAVQALPEGRHRAADIDHFLSEMGWREFSYSLLYHFPELPRTGLQRKFERFPWRDDAQALAAWQRGETGVPIVDAGMRELWRTGYMHNRVRMIVASFLVKNLLLHWHHGEDWFWDTLVDADLANNSASWQWVAGCGADAAPYFRIFNPVTQGQKFDAGGGYVRRYVPELAGMPDKFIHRPWEAPAEVLAAAGVSLGRSYPLPIVDLKASRNRALAAFRALGSQS